MSVPLESSLRKTHRSNTSSREISKARAATSFSTQTFRTPWRHVSDPIEIMSATNCHWWLLASSFGLELLCLEGASIWFSERKLTIPQGIPRVVCVLIVIQEGIINKSLPNAHRSADDYTRRSKAIHFGALGACTRMNIVSPFSPSLQRSSSRFCAIMDASSKKSPANSVLSFHEEAVLAKPILEARGHPRHPLENRPPCVQRSCPGTSSKP